MTTLATYNFTGSNGTTPPNGSGDTPGSIVVAGTVSIQGNACQFTGGGTGTVNKLRLVPVANVAQGITQATVTENAVVGGFQGIFFYQSGAAGAENGYWIYFDAGSWVVDRYDAGVVTNIAAGSFVGTGYYQSKPITFSYDPTGASPVLGITDGTTPHTATDSTAGKRIAAMGVDFWSSDNVSAVSTINAVTITGTAAGSPGNASGAGVTDADSAPTAIATSITPASGAGITDTDSAPLGSASSNLFPGLTFILKDTDSGVVDANLTGIKISIRLNSDDATVQWKSSSCSTNGLGVCTIENSTPGTIGAMPAIGTNVVMTVDTGSYVAAYFMTIVNLGS